MIANKIQDYPVSETSGSLGEIRKVYLILTLFGIAMGFLEGIVVVYMRQVYYPNGFDFPLTMLSPEMTGIEWIRETATIVMLASIGWLAGKNLLQRLSFFLFTFAVWDIIYYVALKLLLGWPSSFLTWDILFLIPVAWIGPVLAPVICSFTMIAMAFLLTFPPTKGIPVKTKWPDWVLIFAGSGIILYTYIKDYLQLIVQSGILNNQANTETKEHFWKTITSFVPDYYNWYLFVTGEVLILIALGWIAYRSGLFRQGDEVAVENKE